VRIADAIFLLGGIALIMIGLLALRKGLARAAGPLIAGIIPPAEGISPAGVTGFLTSALLESHSLAAAAALGLAVANLLPVSQALAMMACAQAGSSAAPLLLCLYPEAGAALAIAGALLLIFYRHRRLYSLGLALAGLGVVTMGMTLLGSVAGTLRNLPLFTTLVLGLASPLPGLLLGMGIAGAAQGATAVVGILQLLFLRGLIGADAAFYMVLGANIGKFVPVLLASADMAVSGRRTAAVSVLGGAFTVLLFLATAQFLPIIPALAAAGGLWVVFAHMGYNAMSAILLLPFSGVLARLAQPSRGAAGDTENLPPGFDDRLLIVPALADKVLRAECCRMGRRAQAAFDAAARACLFGMPAPDESAFVLPEQWAMLVNMLESAGADAAAGRKGCAGRLLCAVRAMERIGCIARDLSDSALDKGQACFTLSGKPLKDAEELLRSAGNILSCALDGLEGGGITTERLLSLRVDMQMSSGVLRGLRKDYAAYAAGNTHPRRSAAFLALAERLTLAADSAEAIARAAAEL
jgi:Na+/phosphate symporter